MAITLPVGRWLLVCLIGAVLASAVVGHSHSDSIADQVALGSTTTGAKIAITQKCLDYVTRTAIPILESAARAATIPDVQGSTHAAGVRIDYSVSQIHIPTFSLGDFRIVSGSSTEPSTLTVVFSQVNIHVQLHWRYVHKKFPHVSDSGSADATSEGAAITLVLGVGVTAEGSPRLSVRSCTVNVGHFNVHLHGGASWLYNILLDMFKGSIAKSARDGIQQAIVQAVNVQVARDLADLRMVLPVDDLAMVDFRLNNEEPLASDGLLMLPALAQVLPQSGHSDFPFQPSPLPNVLAEDSMMHVILSDATANSAGYTYAKAGVLSRTFTQENIPASIPIVLNTAFFKTIIPELFRQFPDMPMELRIAGQPPSVVTSARRISVTLPTVMSLLVVSADGTRTSAFDLTVTIQSQASAWVCSTPVTKLAVCSSLTALQSTFEVSYSVIGKFDPTPLQKIVNSVAEVVVVPLANERLQKGLPIPTLESIALVNPNIVLGEGYLGVSSDLWYKPTSWAGPEGIAEKQQQRPFEIIA